MARKRRKKNIYGKILKRMQRNLWIVFMVVCVLFVILIGRLAYIEYASGEKYERIILAQQQYDSQIIPYQRGDITDVRGTVLATSVDVYNVILDCKVLNSNKDKIESTISYLGASFPQIDTNEIRGILADNPKKQYTVLAKKVSYEDMRNFVKLTEDEETGSKIAGIWFEKEYQRQYPYDSLAASLLGFTTSGNVGMGGVEMYYNKELNGTNGRDYGYVNSDNNVEGAVVEPENGNTVVTTIDVNIQTIVEREIKAFNRRYARDGKPGSKHTAMLVMNPQDGSVLAMANYPTYNLNDPWSLKGVYKKSERKAMSDDEKMDALNKLWQNFCITTTYEPGSTFKPFTVAMGLETGRLSGNESYYCDGYEHIADYNVKCVNRNGHGMLDVRGALMKSCNDALMQMSYAIGSENFADYQRLFGFGQRTGIDLPGEPRTDSLVYDREQLRHTINMATNSFGQNFNTTMIQLGTAFCSIVNGGELYLPHVVDHICDDAGNVVRSFEPVVQKKTLSRETTTQMKDFLRSVVEAGTGAVAGVDGYDIGGKTGTAEKLPRGTGNYLVSFIGYVPQEEPQVVVYCVVDVPNVDDQAHSNYAQEIVHNVFQQILPYMGIEPTVPVVQEETPAQESAPVTAEANTPENTQQNGETANE